MATPLMGMRQARSCTWPTVAPGQGSVCLARLDMGIPELEALRDSLTQLIAAAASVPDEAVGT